MLVISVVSCGLAHAGDVVHQVRLVDASGRPVTGPHDIEVRIMDVATPDKGVACHTTLLPGAVFADGYVTVDLVDVPGHCFDGPAYLSIRTGSPLAELLPRHEVAWTPRALVARQVPTGPTPTGGCGEAGLLLYDTDTLTLRACDGSQWHAVGGSGGLAQSAENAATSCSAVRASQPAAPDGLYYVAYDGQAATAAQVYCAFTPADGGPVIAWAAFEQTTPPLHYWDMSTLDGAQLQDRVGANDLDVVGTPTGGHPGIQGTAYDIANSASFFVSEATFDTSLQGDAVKSISAWFVQDSTTGDGDNAAPVAGFGDGLPGESGCGTSSSFSAIASSGKYAFVGCGDDLYPTTVAATGQWHHIAITYDGAVVRVYGDGVLVGSQAKALNTRGDWARFAVGADPWWETGNHYFTNGRIDEVKVYDFVLSAAQVEALFDLGGAVATP